MGLFDAVKEAITAQPVQPGFAEFDRQLASLEQHRKETITEIGQMFVDNNTVSSVVGTPYEGGFKRLEEVEEQRIMLEKRKLAAQGLRKCEECGNLLPMDSAFCNKCGKKLDALFEETTEAKRFCTKCGSEIVADSAFCTTCGSKINEEN